MHPILGTALAGLVLGLGIAGSAPAQQYPSKPVRIKVLKCAGIRSERHCPLASLQILVRSFSYSLWGPTQNHTMTPSRRTPTARQSRSILTE